MLFLSGFELYSRWVPLLFVIFLKSYSVSSHQLNSIPKIMVQFCYLRLYVGAETVSCRLLLRMARMDADWNLKNLGQHFHVSMPFLQKSPNIYYGLGYLTKFCAISSSRLCRSVVCMGKGTTDHYFWKGVGEGESEGEGGSGLFFYIIWVGHYWNIKWMGVGCIFFYYIETHKGRKIIVILNLLQWIFGFPFFNKVRFLIINITK